MQQYYYFILLFISLSSFTQQTDTLYFDQDWKKTTKEQAAFFRPPPKKEGELYIIEDYYLDGKIQYRAKAKDLEGNEPVGMVKWFFDNGNPSSHAVYNDDSENLRYAEYYYEVDQIIYEYTLVKGEEFEVDVYLPNSKKYASGLLRYNQPYAGCVLVDDQFGLYEDGKLIGKRWFYDNGQIAKEVTCEPFDVGYEVPSDNKIEEEEEIIEVVEIPHEIHVKYFDREGGLIDEMNYEKNPPKKEFKRVYFYVAKRFSDKVYLPVDYYKGIKKIEIIETNQDGYYYGSNKVLKTIKYDEEGKVQEKVKPPQPLPEEKPEAKKKATVLDGLITEQFGEELEKQVTYKKGKKEGKVLFYNRLVNEPIDPKLNYPYDIAEYRALNAEGIYKNDQPWSGQFIEQNYSWEYKIWNYKKGKKIGKQVFVDEKSNYFFHVENELLNGLMKGVDNGIYYDMEYKDGEPLKGVEILGFDTENQQIEHRYENGELVYTRRANYVLGGKQGMEMNFKNGKPYEGCYTEDYREALCFEKGVPVARYTATEADGDKRDGLIHWSNKITY